MLANLLVPSAPMKWTGRALTRARLGRVRHMTYMRIAIAVLILGTFTGCDLLDPASSDEASAPTPSSSPTSFQLNGTVSMEYTLSDVHTCEDVLLAELPAPETREEVTAKIRHQEAQSQIELVMDRNVSVIDADEDEHLATVSTGDEIETAEAEDADAEADAVACVASTSFDTVLPPVDSYRFVVRGVTGRAEPVDYEELQAAGFVCDIRLSSSGRLVEEAPCGISG